MLEHFYNWMFPQKTEKGGPGSGNHGHAGRPGKVGGSAPKGSFSGAVIVDKDTPHAKNFYGTLIAAGILGENERFAEGTTPEQVFDYTRRKMREFDTERMVVFESDGWACFSKTGDKSTVEFTDSDVRYIRSKPNSVTIHNHPGEYYYEKDIQDSFPDFVHYGNSFSDDDNHFQWNTGNKVMQAISRKHGAIYTMEMKNGFIDDVNKHDYLAMNYDKVISLAERCVTEVNFMKNIDRFPLAFLESTHCHARCMVLSRFKPNWFKYTATDIDGNPLDYSDSGNTPGLPKFDFEELVNDALELLIDRIQVRKTA